ncbi:hypothetical protein [Phyllobacterium leguminum]|uniref:hypothetical protein n=1 Tax=Phyllobacterium leguminum TaxID=314237 RepID=UPI001FE13876|nr:hypothetical protein [Phyllobacterium leguminum]
MKTVRIGPDEIFHRYLTPKWAFLPTSRAGAAIDGKLVKRQMYGRGKFDLLEAASLAQPETSPKVRQSQFCAPVYRNL